MPLALPVSFPIDMSLLGVSVGKSVRLRSTLTAPYISIQQKFRLQQIKLGALGALGALGVLAVFPPSTDN
jgi:hypothetical protein